MFCEIQLAKKGLINGADEPKSQTNDNDIDR